MPATNFKDYYQILGVGKTASESDIKRKFRKLARKYHPDMNPGDRAAEAKFKEINEAYEVLSDPDKRKKYDQFGQYWQQVGRGQPGAGVDMSGFDFDFGQYGNFDEFINELLGRFGGARGGYAPGGGQSYTYRTSTGGPTGFGGFGDFADFATAGQGAAGQSAPADAQAEISLTFQDALKGAQKRLTIGGSETITVRIPAGAKPGNKIRVRGKGQINPMTQARGDLYLIVKLQSHPFYRFEGNNLLCELPITPDEAVLGAKVEVPTPAGTVTMNIPAGIKSGQSLRLRGKGWPSPKGNRSDQIVKIQIVPPKELSKTERDCYEKIAAQRSFNPRSHLKGI